MRSTYPTIFKADVVPLVSARYDGGGEVYTPGPDLTGYRGNGGARLPST